MTSYSPEFIRSLREGCPHRFSRVAEDHRARLRAIGLRITRCPETTEDCLQDALLKAYRAIHTFDGRSEVAPWLSRVMINTCFMRLRRERSRRSWALRLATEPEPRTPADPWTVLSARQELSACLRSLDALPDRHREVLELRAIEGLST
jgi:RNA polymerase sigma-70 factor (ECF subfamily)